jgi:phosphoribosylformylglycinamidine cyclo-ligase
MSEREHVEGYNTEQLFLESIQAAVERTRSNPERDRRVVFNPDGTYSISAERLRDSSDTIGTKADLHWQARTFDSAAQDAFAMNYNDLVRDRCEPLMLTNVIMIEDEDDDAIAMLADGLSRLSCERGIQMGDGETAILNTMPGFELSVTMTGAAIDEAPNWYEAGDVLIGIPSEGIHSNGLTDARRLFGSDWPPELVDPTRVYDEIPRLVKAGHEIHGMTHVTGGGLSKLKTPGADLVITQTHPKPSAQVFHKIFERWMDEAGATFSSGTESAWVDEKMHLKFNSGIGFVIGCPPEAVAGIQAEVPDAVIIGEVRKGDGSVVIEQSAYTGRPVIL